MKIPQEFFTKLIQPGVIAERLAQERPFYVSESGTNLEGDVLGAVTFFGMSVGLSAIKSSFEVEPIEPYNTCIAVGIGIGLLTIADADDRLDTKVRKVLQIKQDTLLGKRSRNYRRISSLANQSLDDIHADAVVAPIYFAIRNRSAENFDPNPNEFVISGLGRALNVIESLREEERRSL